MKKYIAMFIFGLTTFLIGISTGTYYAEPLWYKTKVRRLEAEIDYEKTKSRVLESWANRLYFELDKAVKNLRGEV